MISNLAYTNRDFYTSNQVRSGPKYALSGLTDIVLYTRDFHHLVNTLTSTESIISTIVLTKLMFI